MKIKILLASSVATAMLISGCSSSSDDSTKTTGTPGQIALSGTVAQGQALIAEITVQGSQGNRITVSSGRDGAYEVSSLSSITAPYIIRATTADGIVLYSFVINNADVANITPLTSYIVDQAAEETGANNASYLFSTFQTAQNIAAALELETAALNRVLAGAMTTGGVAGFDHFTTPFDADHSGYDGLLDAMDIELVGDDIIIREDGQILETLPYDVTDTNITVSGYISNALDDTGLDGVTLSFTNAHHNTTVQTVSGSYSVVLDFGRTYDVSISAAGYDTVTFSNLSTFEITNISTQLVPLIPDTVDGTGTVNGSVIDARTGDAVIGVTLEFREGLNNRSGTVVASTTTDSVGTYDISTIETGNYTIAYKAEGYNVRYVDAIVLGGYSRTFNTQLVRENIANENSAGSLATIVLEWGANPSDLDSHLTGPNENATSVNDRFRLYYSNTRITTSAFSYATEFDASQPCLTEGVVASLDLDDTSSYGPETTTVCQGYEGTYKFYVHHFSGSGSIASSPTKVTVTTMHGATFSWTAPSSVTTNDWHVFDIDNFGNVVPVNSYLLNGESRQSASLIDESDIFDNLPAK